MATSNSNQIKAFGEWVGRNLLFSDVLESDGRKPCMTFTVPDFILNYGGDKFGLLAPRIEFWIALLVSLVIGSLFSTCISCITYQFIVFPRKEHTKKQGKQENQPITPFLVGFGIIMPLCAFSPYYGLRYFLIKNKLIKFLAGVAQLTSFFRCSEAMFGFLPAGVDDSLTNLITYSLFPVEVKFNNNKVLKSTWSNVSYYFVKSVKWTFILGFYSSVLQAYDYELYPKSEGPTLQDIHILTGFTRPQLINNLSIAILFQLVLTTFGYHIYLFTSLCGVQQNPMMLNPIFESSSVSDFWGRRWNLVVHGILKRGVYKPVRTKFSRSAATIATFMASGFFHEWLLSIAFYPDNVEDARSCLAPLCYVPGYGRNTMFFIWNAALIGLETAVGGAALCQLFKKHLPLTIISLFVTATALPAVHWFTNDYVRTDFFTDIQIGFPIIVRVVD